MGTPSRKVDVLPAQREHLTRAQARQCADRIGHVQWLRQGEIALLAAGSRATVTTLWRVADQPTAEFMRQFYFQLGRLEPKAQALRLAKLKLLRSGTALQHPQFWAAFVMNGDGLSPMVRVFSWSSLLAP